MNAFVQSEWYARQALSRFQYRLMWCSVVGVFLAELFVMLAAHWLEPRLGHYWFAFLDAGLLTAMIVPGVYFVVLRPVARLTAKLAAESAEARFQAVVEAACDPIIVADARGTIRFANAASEPVFGRTPAELAGQNLVELMPVEFQERHREGLQKYQETGEAHFVGKGPVEMEAQKKDGTRFPVELSVNQAPIGQEICLIAVIRDLTQRKRIRMYESFLPVCCVCGKIRDDTGVEHGKGTWGALQDFVAKRSTAKLSHGFCPDCFNTQLAALDHEEERKRETLE